MTVPADDLRHLVEKAAWLRRLAGALVRDAADADDLAQATALAAVLHRPDSLTPLGGWLATVLRRFRALDARSRRRREEREREVAATEAVASSSELAARLETHERVLAALKSLDEPYRSTVLLRFFEGLDSAEIARRTGVVPATVRTRLHRALALLRVRLESDYREDGRSWRGAVALLAPGGFGTSLPQVAWTGVALMNVKIVGAALGILVAGIASFVLFFDSPQSGSPKPAVNALGSPEIRDVGNPPEVATSPERAIVEPAVDDSVTDGRIDPMPLDAGFPAIEVTAEGRVLDFEGRAKAGVRVCGAVSRGDPCEAVSDPDGAFVLRSRAPIAVVTADDPGLVTLFSGHPGAHGISQFVLVVAPAIAIGGHVANESGAPVPDATIEIALPANLRHRFDSLLDASEPEAFATKCAEDATFRLDKVPAIPGATLLAGATGFERTRVLLSESSDLAMAIVLSRGKPAGAAVIGQVIDSAGALVADAVVALRGGMTRTDEQGRFSLEIRDAKGDRDYGSQLGVDGNTPSAASGADPVAEFGARIVAVKAGLAPAVYTAPIGPSGPEFPAFVVLQLGAGQVSITGRVEGEDGTAIGNAVVWIADPTFFGFDESRGPLLLENELANEREETWRRIRTDDEGRFTIDGLTERAYRVVAMDPKTVAAVTLEGVVGGSRGVVLRIPTQALLPRVAGRVMTRDGRGVANAEIRATRDAFRRTGGTWMESGASTSTDLDGHFELTDVPQEGVYLRIDGEGIESAEVGHGAARLTDVVGDVANIVVEVLREVHVRVELADRSRADAFSLLDPSDARLTLYEVSPGGRAGHPKQKLVDGRSSVLVVRETASRIVLWKGDTEVDRVPIVIDPDGVTTIR